MVNVLLFYTTCISVDLAHHEIFRAKVGKGGKTNAILMLESKMVCVCCDFIAKYIHALEDFENASPRLNTLLLKH